MRSWNDCPNFKYGMPNRSGQPAIEKCSLYDDIVVFSETDINASDGLLASICRHIDANSLSVALMCVIYCTLALTTSMRYSHWWHQCTTRTDGINTLLALTASMRAAQWQQCVARIDGSNVLRTLMAAARYSHFKCNVLLAHYDWLDRSFWRCNSSAVEYYIYIYIYRWQLGNRTLHRSPIEVASGL